MKKIYLNCEKGFIFILKNSSAGFTLIEVLVTVALIGILATVASTIFINTIRNSQKTAITNEAKQNAELVFEQFQRDIKNSLFISPSGVFTTAPCPPYTTCYKNLVITPPGGSQILWQCVNQTATANGFLVRKPKASPLATPITNKDPVNGVSVTNCYFAIPPGTSNSYTLGFTLREGVKVQDTANEVFVNLPYETTVNTQD